MATKRDDTAWLPPWVAMLDTPVWVTAPDRTISYVNTGAETVLGLSAADCVGLACHGVVAATDASGCPFCGPRCKLLRLAIQNQPIPPVELRLSRPDGSSTWVWVLPIAVRAPDGEGTWLVHCALNTDRAHRLEAYLTKVANRTSAKDPESDRGAGGGRVDGGGRGTRDTLTKREEEVLRLLAEDADLRSIAASLHLSYSTVRNHVQHILGKLGVHAISEAVAYHILRSD